MDDFLRFPHTPHIAWLGTGPLRDDKLLAPDEVSSLLAGDVIVEEKVDGANLGFSVDEHGALRAQNRGSYLPLDAPQGQWRPLKRWLGPRQYALADALFPDLMLFGEWCYAVHSIHYTRLPDWFVAFDVYDRAKGEFWSAARRNALASELGVCVVPTLGRGRFDVPALRALLGHSQLTDGPAEGLYVRAEMDDRLVSRAKLVSPHFTQAIDEHWSKRALEPNALVPGAGYYG